MNWLCHDKKWQASSSLAMTSPRKSSLGNWDGRNNKFTAGGWLIDDKLQNFLFDFRLIVTIYDLRCAHGRDANIYIYTYYKVLHICTYVITNITYIIYIHYMLYVINCKYLLIISQQHHFFFSTKTTMLQLHKAPSFLPAVKCCVATCLPGQIFGSQGTWVDDLGLSRHGAMTPNGKDEGMQNSIPGASKDTIRFFCWQTQMRAKTTVNDCGSG